MIKNLLYNGTVELAFQEFGHKYTWNGSAIKNVTNITGIINKPQLIPWAARMTMESIQAAIKPGVAYDELQLMQIMEEGKAAHSKRKTDAGAFGKFVHKWIEDYIGGKNPVVPENKQLRDSVEKFLTWEKTHNVEILLSEQMVFSKKYRYVGTLDCIGKINGKLFIIDWKTSSGIYPFEMGMQVAAYKLAREEEFPQEKYEGIVIVRIDKKDGSLHMWTLEDEAVLTMFRHSFLYALKLTEMAELVKRFEYSDAFKKGVIKL